MNIDSAKKIQNRTQHCIQQMNEALLAAKSELTTDDFEIMKAKIAEAMGCIIEVEHAVLYSKYPELMPYKIG